MSKREQGIFRGASRLATAAVSGLALASALAPTGSAAQADRQDAAEAEDRVLFEADLVTRADKQSPIVATGNVRAYSGERFLTADRLEYDPATDVVTAYGQVAITSPSGETYFSDEMVLTGDLADGVASNFSALLVDDSRLAAATVTKRGEERNILNRAVYSACDVCTEDGDPKRPAWQVKALRVVQDKDAHTIRFYSAFMELFGIPILYTPYFQIPDPSVERQSGLLTPSFGTTTTLGIYLQTPYYHVISDYQDVTISPKFMEKQGVLVQGEYRVRNWRGGAVVQAGIIDARESSEFFVDDRPGSNTPGTRYHIFSAGNQIFADNWLGSYDIEHVSDKRYLSVYDVEREGDLERPGNLYRPDRLTNVLEATRRTDTSLLNVAGIAFQSLRSREDNDYAGHALPRIRYNSVLDTPWLDGHTEIDAEFLSLIRRDGLQSRHGVLSAGWERDFTTGNGHRFTLFGEMRGDVYNYDQLSEGTDICNPASLSDSDYATCIALAPEEIEEGSQTTTRFLPTIGADWSYPLGKQTDYATFIIEPRIQLVVSPEQDYIGEIINEDSQFFEFDPQTLFRPNKSAGYDLWEDGQRANVGLAASADFESGFSIGGSVGQQFRTEESEVYSAYGLQSGLGETSSDLVATLDVGWRSYLRVQNSLRFDRSDGSVERAQSLLSARYGRAYASASYLKARNYDSDSELAGTDEFLKLSGGLTITENWSTAVSVSRDVAAETNTRESLSVIYENECMEVIFAYKNDPRRDLDFEFNETFSINILLKGINQ